MKYWEIELDGCDRTGKDTVLRYLEILTNYKYSINVRGYLSQKVYSKKYNRNYLYDEESLSRNRLYVLLWANEEDLKIRGLLTSEKENDYINDTVRFMEESDRLTEKGYKTLSCNTSYYSPYRIARRIIETMDKLNKGENDGKY